MGEICSFNSKQSPSSTRRLTEHMFYYTIVLVQVIDTICDEAPKRMVVNETQWAVHMP
jgi:hypothetical protein